MSKARRPGRPSTTNKAVRASFTMSKATQQALAQLAKKKKVSFSWVLRDAAERYVEANKGHPDASEKNA